MHAREYFPFFHLVQCQCGCTGTCHVFRYVFVYLVLAPTWSMYTRPAKKKQEQLESVCYCRMRCLNELTKTLLLLRSHGRILLTSRSLYRMAPGGCTSSHSSFSSFLSSLSLVSFAQAVGVYMGMPESIVCTSASDHFEKKNEVNF